MYFHFALSLREIEELLAARGIVVTIKWLGKGIADMLMQDFAEVEGLIVLEHDHLQTLLEEMELQKSAFLEQR